MAAFNSFAALPVESFDSYVVIPKKITTIPQKKTTPKKVNVPDIQCQYPLTLITYSGTTNNEFFIGRTKISSVMKLNKNTSFSELETVINKMDLPYSCLVWSSTIDTPELEKMVSNQYPLPAEYQHLHDLMCDDTIKSMKRQNVLILDFRRTHIQGSEYVYLPNHTQLFFGNVRDSYLTRKSEVSGLKKYYEVFCHRFNFSEMEKVIFECHKYALTAGDSIWVNYREEQVKRLKEAASVFSSDEQIFERFKSFEDLKKEIEMAFLYKKELLERLPKMKLEYNRKMIIDVKNSEEEFPSLPN